MANDDTTIGSGADPLGPQTVNLSPESVNALGDKLDSIFNQGSLAQGLASAGGFGLAGAGIGGILGGRIAAGQLGFPKRMEDEGRAAYTKRVGVEGITGLGGALTTQSVQAIRNTAEAAEILAKSLGFAAIDIDQIAKGFQASGVPAGALGIHFSAAAEQLGGILEKSTFLREALKEGGPQAERLAGTIAALGAQYVAAGGQADQFSDLVESVGRNLVGSTKDTAGFQKALEQVLDSARGLSTELNIPFNDAVAAFGTTLGDVNLLGLDPFVRNIVQLEAASKATGISMEGLFGISQKFNTLPSAADTVGELSAVLRGTTLGVDQLLAAEPVERVQLVLGEIQSAISEGRFELAESGQERIFQLQAMASAAGLTAQELNKILIGEKDISEVLSSAGKIATQSVEEQSVAIQKSLGPTKTQATVMAEFSNRVATLPGVMDKFTASYQKGIRIIRQGLAEDPSIPEAFGNIGKSIATLQLQMGAITEEAGPAGLLGTLFFGKGTAFGDAMTLVEDSMKSGQEIANRILKSVTQLQETTDVLKNVQAESTPRDKAPRSPDPLAPAPPAPMRSGSTTANQEWTLTPAGSLKGKIEIPNFRNIVGRAQTQQLKGDTQ